MLQNAVAQYKEQFMGTALAIQEDKRYLMIKSGGTHVKVCLNNIVYAEVFNRKVLLHCVWEDVEYYRKLTELEKRAGEDFFRSHMAYLVHFKYVVKYDAITIWDVCRDRNFISCLGSVLEKGVNWDDPQGSRRYAPVDVRI